MVIKLFQADAIHLKAASQSPDLTISLEYSYPDIMLAEFVSGSEATVPSADDDDVRC